MTTTVKEIFENETSEYRPKLTRGIRAMIKGRVLTELGIETLDVDVVEVERVRSIVKETIHDAVDEVCLQLDALAHSLR